MAETARRDLLLLYDFLQTRGGAERVLHCLHAHFAAPVCVGFVEEASFGKLFATDDLIDLGAGSKLPALAIARVLHAFNGRGARVAASYQTRIFSGSYAPLANRGFGHGRSIYYCHTPPRFLYDLRDHYQARFPPWQRPLLAVLRRWLQPRYEAAVRGMDVVLANSRNVQRRLQDYLGVASRVVYPPVDTDRFRWLADDGYFLSTARLEPLKRVDMLVRAFKRMPSKRLVVSSGGSELARLKALAADAPNIQFSGWLDDAQLRALMGRARASIYVPVDEDFGMSPVESMAAGKPVIGVAEGGLLETVTDGETGILLSPQFGEEDVIAAVSALDPNRAASMRTACIHRAERFSSTRFLKEIGAVLHCG